MKRWLRTAWSRVPRPKRARSSGDGAEIISEFDREARRIAEDLRRVERRLRERVSHNEEHPV
jgi:hypothetical protein